MAKKRTDGRYKVTFTYNGKRITVYGKTITEARTKAEEKKQELKQGTYIKNEHLTLDQYHERWAEARTGTVKESTIRKQTIEYKIASNTVIDKSGTTFGSIKITELEAQNMRDLQKALNNARYDSGKKRYNTNTINGIINHVKHILNDAIKERIIEWNPACSVKMLKRTEEEARNTKHRALTPEETKAFYDSCTESWYYNLLKFLLFSGCRIGEAGALTMNDINRKKGVIEIRRTITKTEYGTYTIGDTPKTKHGQRDIPLTKELLEIITEQNKLNSLINGNVISMDKPIFTSPEGYILDVTCVNREIERKCKLSNVERFTAHALRDTFATRAIESGMNPKTLQEILGHADIGITMNLYAHVMDDTKSKEMNNIIIAL